MDAPDIRLPRSFRLALRGKHDPFSVRRKAGVVVERLRVGQQAPLAGAVRICNVELHLRWTDAVHEHDVLAHRGARGRQTRHCTHHLEGHIDFSSKSIQAISAGSSCSTLERYTPLNSE